MSLLDYRFDNVRCPHFVNNARKAGTARTFEFALSRARSPARLPTNSGDFRASYLASGFGVMRLLATLYPLMPRPVPSLTTKSAISRDLSFISDLPDRQ